MLGQEHTDDRPSAGTPRKTYCRSVSWSVTTSPSHDANPNPNPNPRNSKARSCLPPLQPLSISRRDLAGDWPKPGSDDLGVWPNPSTPRAKPNMKAENSASVIFPAREFQLRKDKLAFFDKECSRIADHIYLGGDAVARNREILRQNGITHVLNCVGFVCPEYFKSDLVYKTLWLQDSPTEDITSILYDVFDYFEDVRDQGGRVLVHCCQGVSRSTSLVIAYLMWKDGQSFEDAFQFVKAARGITNPNMGFACQLLLCQKRVHAVPVSPSSVLRIYRMAPHSPYDPLHLVPKLLNYPSALALDSRGAFLVHIPSAIYVWIGKECNTVMASNARAAASQVVRYERAKGPIVSVQEGDEPAEFWEALASAPLIGEDMGKTGEIREGDSSAGSWCAGKDHVLADINLGLGKKRVELYDVDFEIFRRALGGGVVPPFPLSETGYETHLPARENGWGRLRRKFASGGVKELVTASRLSRVTDTCKEEEPSLPDPCCLPDSFSWESNTSLKPSSKSPSPSPTDSSSWKTLSPSSSAWSDYSFSSSQSSPQAPEFSDPYSAKHASQEENGCLPYKGSFPSLAERRGSNAPSLKFLPAAGAQSPVSKNLGRAWSFAFPSSKEDIMELECEDFDNSSRSEKLLDADMMGSDKEMHVGTTDGKAFGIFHSEPNISVGNGIACRNPLSVSTAPVVGGPEPPQPNDMIDGIADPSQPVLYQWPTMERVEVLHAGVLDSRSVFILLTPITDTLKNRPEMLYVWVGRDTSFEKGWCDLINSSKIEDRHIYWEKVGHSFLYQMRLPMSVPVEIIREDEEPQQFLAHLSFFTSSGRRLT